MLALFAFLTVVYSLASIVRYEFFGTGSDLTIFFQGLTSARFETYIKGPGRSVFGDHFHPLILLCWPMLQVLPSPITLLVAQAASISLAITTLAARWAREHPEHWGWALVAAVAPGIQGAAIFDFHEVALAAPLVAWWIVLVMDARWGLATGIALSVLLVKEDAALLVAGMAIVHLLRGRRWSASLLGVSSVVWWLTVTKVVIPAIAGADYAWTGVLPDSFSEGLQNLARAFIFPGLESLTLFASIALFGFKPLRSSISLAIIPYALALGIVDNFRYQTFYYHYYLLPTLFLIGAAMEGLSSPLRLPRPGVRAAATVLAILAVIAGPTATALYTLPWGARDAALQATALVPEGARVASDPALTARLATSARVSQVRPPDFVDGHGLPMPDVDWVILDTDTQAFGGSRWVSPMVQTLTDQGFTVTARVGSFLVLHRTAEDRVTSIPFVQPMATGS